MNLKKITKNDLILDYMENCTSTNLIMKDFDWMNYSISTKFETEEMGILYVTFEYFGSNFSTMKVEQVLKEKNKEYEFKYSTDIFMKYLKMYLEEEIKMIDSTTAFDGEDIVLSFFNEVLDTLN